MKIRVTSPFRDRECDLAVRMVGDILTVTKERGEHLIVQNLAEQVEEKTEKSE